MCGRLCSAVSIPENNDKMAAEEKMTKKMTKKMIHIRNQLTLLSLHTRIALLRFKTRKVQMLKEEFVIYTLLILFIGLGLGMFWRARQVEPNLKAQINMLSKSRSELAVSQYSQYRIGKNQIE